MNYSLFNIRTAADCDLLIEIAELAQKDLDYQKTTVERKQENYSTSATDIEIEIASTIAEIASLDVIIADLTGKAKIKQVNKKRKMELNLLLLQDKKVSSGVIAMLAKEFELGQVQKQIAEAAAFLAAVQARKNQLTLPQPVE